MRDVGITAAALAEALVNSCASDVVSQSEKFLAANPGKHLSVSARAMPRF
jgi:hypothetical protein